MLWAIRWFKNGKKQYRFGVAGKGLVVHRN